MFVKIMWFNVKKGDDQTIIYSHVIKEKTHDVLSAELESAPPEEGKKVGQMILTLDKRAPEKEVIYFPWESPDKVTEVYYMNNEGKTIERYVY